MIIKKINKKFIWFYLNIKLNNLNIMSNIKIKIKLIKIIQINYILLKTICFFKIIT